MRLQDIYIYPIKSLGGIRLSEAKVEIPGFAYDRRWMLVDEKGRFMTQRKHHQMALLQVRLTEGGLVVFQKQRPDQSHFIPFIPQTDRLISVTVWDDTMAAQIVSDRSNQWFSEALKVACQLVYMPSSTERAIDDKYAVNQETVSFADAMPYLLIGQSSLDDLNKKLTESLPMDRFRPNLVFSGGNAFEEDEWGHVKIGECTFKVTKPCARCVMTTVNQATGKAGKEPLKTLAGYRSVNNNVLFGQNMIALTLGYVQIGDEIIPC